MSLKYQEYQERIEYSERWSLILGLLQKYGYTIQRSIIDGIDITELCYKNIPVFKQTEEYKQLTDYETACKRFKMYMFMFEYITKHIEYIYKTIQDYHDNTNDFSKKDICKKILEEGIDDTICFIDIKKYLDSKSSVQQTELKDVKTAQEMQDEISEIKYWLNEHNFKIYNTEDFARGLYKITCKNSGVQSGYEFVYPKEFGITTFDILDAHKQFKEWVKQDLNI